MIVADTLSRRPDFDNIALNSILTKASLPLFDKIRLSYDQDPDFGSIFSSLSTSPDPSSKYILRDGCL